MIFFLISLFVCASLSMLELETELFLLPMHHNHHLHLCIFIQIEWYRILLFVFQEKDYIIFPSRIRF